MSHYIALIFQILIKIDIILLGDISTEIYI